MRTALARWFGRPKGMQHKLLSWPLALALVVLIHVVSAVVLLKLNFNNAPEVYYPDDSPAVILRNALRADFPSDEVLTVLFRSDQLYGPDFLRRLDRLAEDLGKNPLIDRVMTATTMEKIAATDDGFEVRLLVDPEQLEDSTPEALRQQVLDDRFAPDTLASANGRYMPWWCAPCRWVKACNASKSSAR
jgi:predicted RND superfamily exporter protein